MRIEYSGKKIPLTEALKAKMEKKLQKLARFTGKTSSAHVSFEVERHKHRVDLVIQATHDRVFKARSSADDMYVAISDAADAIEQQAKKDKEKRIAGRSKGEKRTIKALEEASSKEDAKKEKKGKASPVNHRPDLYVPKPTSLQDALLLLEERKDPALVFTEASSGNLTVLVRQGKTRVLLIEPPISG